MAKLSITPRHEMDPTPVGQPLAATFDAGSARTAVCGESQGDMPVAIPAAEGVLTGVQGTVLLLAGEAQIQAELNGWLTEQGFALGVLTGRAQVAQIFAVMGPACLVLDMDAYETNGFEVLAEWRRHQVDIPVIVLSSQTDVPRVVRAMRLGAHDFLPKPHDPEELRQAIGWALRRAATTPDAPSAAELIRQRAATLTQRERDVLQSVARGCLNKQVASQLGVALVTVKVYRARAMRKLGVKTAAELGRMAELAGF